jgi:hypothetical protein
MVDLWIIEIQSRSVQGRSATSAQAQIRVCFTKDQYKQNTLLLTVMQRAAYHWHGRSWYSLLDLNQRPTPYQDAALPTELRKYKFSKS